MTNQEIAVEIMKLAQNHYGIDESGVDLQMNVDYTRIRYNNTGGILVTIQYNHSPDYLCVHCNSDASPGVWGIYNVTKVIELFRSMT